MIYLARKPAPPLRQFVKMLWYAKLPDPGHGYQRILPTGCAQVIFNLSRDFLVDCLEDGTEEHTAPALVVGQRSVCEFVACSDMADLIGAVFVPGALAAFTKDRADLFSNRNVPLDQVCNGSNDSLRNRLRETSSPAERLHTLENWLLANVSSRTAECRFSLHPAVDFALQQFARSSPMTSVAEVARETGWSERHFSQKFREQVGFAPKAWWRIQRFQRVLQHLGSRMEIPLADWALDCGFYDQAHFANEFRCFSGIDVTTYNATRHQLWTNHTRSQ